MDKYVDEIMDELSNYATFTTDEHTCERWNGLGDDHFGEAMLDYEWREKAKTLIQQQLRKAQRDVLEEACDEIRYRLDVNQGQDNAEAHARIELGALLGAYQNKINQLKQEAGDE